MAEDKSPKGSQDDDDIPQQRIEDHNLTFSTFMRLTQVAIIIVAIILIGLAVFLL